MKTICIQSAGNCRGHINAHGTDALYMLLGNYGGITRDTGGPHSCHARRLLRTVPLCARALAYPSPRNHPPLLCFPSHPSNIAQCHNLSSIIMQLYNVNNRTQIAARVNGIIRTLFTTERFRRTKHQMGCDIFPD